MGRQVYFVSDGTGITAGTLGKALLTQFRGVSFTPVSLPFVDTPDKAERALERINAGFESTGLPPVVFSTLVDPRLRQILARCNGLVFDFFEAVIGKLEAELGVQAEPLVGKMHGISDDSAYMTRINAVNFFLMHDNGITQHEYARADVILVGASRVGKTPTCLYLAMQFGLLVANYPLTDEDLANATLPDSLIPYRDRLFGLTIRPERLHDIREQRRPDSNYASLAQCRAEVTAAEGLFGAANIPSLNTTTTSIEEIATTIIDKLGLQRRFF